MKRNIYNDLLKWKNNSNRKPLILEGARQVGKTWIVKEFGRNEFQQVAYLNFESGERLRSLFNIDFEIKRIISTIEIEINHSINAENTLIIFDEIQEAEKGLTVLKYFYEQRPEYFIIATGSLLGISLQQNNSFPVGKVDFLKMYPMSFLEFLMNIGQTLLRSHLEAKNWNVISSFHEKLIAYLRQYYFIGGMPEAVASYISQNDLNTVRSIQQKIILGYENDFAKYAPIALVPKIRLVWTHIISQLAKENRKFIYGQLKKGSRAKDFQEAIDWLVSAGLVLKVNLVENPTIPLKAYINLDSFKLLLVDIGLLNALADVDPRILLENNKILIEFKGAMTEQYVGQQLKMKTDLYYWAASRANAEVDFIIQNNSTIIPIEVKAEENLKAKSLRVYGEKFKPAIAIRTSMSFYKKEAWVTNIPLYAISEILQMSIISFCLYSI